MYNLISSGSKGNAIIYMDSIMVDCGTPFSVIKPHLYKLQIVLLTHIHQDHFNAATIQRIAFERPSLRIGCCEWMYDHVKSFRNVDVFEIGELYDYGSFKISPVKLYHDSENCGFRVFKDGKKIFHATDSAHLEGITAKNYDLYAIEFNYDEDTIDEIIAAQKARGEFVYKIGAVNSHLSEQQARDFIYKNKGPGSQVLRLHETSLTV